MLFASFYVDVSPGMSSRVSLREPEGSRSRIRGLLRVLHRPAAGEAPSARTPARHRGRLGERARCGYAIEAVKSAVGCADVGGQAGHGAQIRAPLEHGVVAVFGQRRGGQHAVCAVASSMMNRVIMGVIL